MTNSVRCLALKILVLLMLQGVSGTILAQPQRKIDSLRALLPGQTAEERADIFYELAYEYVDLNYRLGKEYGERSFYFSKSVGDSLRMVKAGRITVLAFSRLGKLDSAIRLGLELLPVAVRNNYSKQRKQISRSIAVAYTFKANYALGLKYNLELLKATEQENDSIEMSYALSNIGLIFYKLMNHKKALQYYQRSLDVKSSLDKHPRTGTFVNMSLCYSILKDFLRAGEFLKKAFDVCQPECSDAFMIEWLHANGRFHFYKENLDSAEIYYLRSYSLTKKLSNERYQLVVALDLIDLYYQRNRNSLAARYLSEVEPIIERTSFEFEQMWLYSRFSSFCKKTGNDKERAFYLEKCIQLVDSINSQLTNSLVKIESEYLERKNKARIAEQEQLLTLKDQVIRWQNALNILIGIITILLITLLYLLYRSNRQRKSANRLLDLKVGERTAALESSHIAIRQSIEKEDGTLADTFIEIKSLAGFIKELCTLGLETEHAEPRKCLEEISRLTGRVSSVLTGIRGDK